MKCILINFRLAVEWLAILFFAISGVICLSAYFDSQNLQENERIILLISGIVHLVLFVLAFLSFSYTMTILGPYLSEDCKSSILKTFIKIEKLNKPKGQLISGCLFDFFKFSKKTNKKFDKFLPQNLKSGQITIIH